MCRHCERHDHSSSVTATSSENCSDDETSVQVPETSLSVLVSRDGRKVENGSEGDDVIADVLAGARTHWLEMHDAQNLRSALLSVLLVLASEE